MARTSSPAHLASWPWRKVLRTGSPHPHRQSLVASGVDFAAGIGVLLGRDRAVMIIEPSDLSVSQSPETFSAPRFAAVTRTPCSAKIGCHSTPPAPDLEI